MAQIGFKGAEVDLLVRQGATFLATLTITNPDTSPVNLTGMIFRAQIRKTFNDPVITASFVCTVLSAPNGLLEIELPATVTAAIPAGATELDPISAYVWDLEAEESSGRVVPYLYGVVRVFREVTKA